MKIIILKKPAWIGIIIGFLLLIGAGIFLLFSPKKPDAKAILAETKRYDLQNICLLSLLEKEPGNQAYWQQLLDQYQAMGADPLTIYSAKEQAKQQTGVELSPTPEAGIFTPGAPLRSTAENGIAPQGKALPKGFYAGAYDGAAVTYLAAEDGLYAQYRGIRVRLAPIQADRLIPAENGLYYINTTQHRLQFIAADGGNIKTLSTVDAIDFACLGEDLYLLDTAGALFRNGEAIELPAPGKRLAAMGDSLYIALENGIYSLSEKSLIYEEKTNQLIAGEQELYFLNKDSELCRLIPGESAEVLKNISAISLDRYQNTVWYLSSKNKIKKFRLS